MFKFNLGCTQYKIVIVIRLFRDEPIKKLKPCYVRSVCHDLQGCDASVLLQGNGTEQSDPANRSLGGFSVVNSAKRVLEIFCPGTVSCADIVVLAARDAVQMVKYPSSKYLCCPTLLNFPFYLFMKAWKQAGGPVIQIPTGRRDGLVSAASNVRPNIVDTSFSVDEMIKLFSSKGMSVNDLVTLSGNNITLPRQ